MCGISLYLINNKNITEKYKILSKWLDKLNNIHHRGPDNTKHIVIENDEWLIYFGFHRLAINGSDKASNQPFIFNNIYMIVNGEIWNHRELEKKYNIVCKSKSDCEVIIHLYNKIGFENMIKELNGEYGIVVFDDNKKELYIGRDRFGIRSLYYVENGKDDKLELSVCSEGKGIYKQNKDTEIKVFPPSSYYHLKLGDKSSINNYYNLRENIKNKISDENECIKNINILFEKAIEIRMMSEHNIACLLSGGLDSSLVVSVYNKLLKNKNKNSNVYTYSIGLPGSTDLKFAKEVAEYLGTIHTTIEVTEDEFFNAIEDVIKQIESYDTTTVRASVGQYLVCNYIKNHSLAYKLDIKCIMCGDISDEIFGSYRGFMLAPNEELYELENIKQIENVNQFDILRAEKSIAGNSLEGRVPFADYDFVEYVMSIDPKLKMFNDNRMEKYILRKAFENGYLPDSVLWRRKEAFSDGVSSHERSWCDIIKEKIDNIYSDDDFIKFSANYEFNKPYDKESLYYRTIFSKYYDEDMDKTIPYFWRHPFCTETDPSARKLECYKQTD